MKAHNKFPGWFITFEGSDSTGKTTNVGHLVERLKEQGYDVIKTREPGGTVLGEKIRDILLHGNAIAGKTELLLFAAARAEHMDKVILPALRDGKVVISDRFHDSSYAYQGVARDMVYDVSQLERFTLQDFEPDYTLFFDLPLVEAERRMIARRKLPELTEGAVPDRFESEQRDFFRRVHDGFQERFKSQQHRMVRIDALPDEAAVTEQIISWANATFPTVD